jgi:hypothetical protein
MIYLIIGTIIGLIGIGLMKASNTLWGIIIAMIGLAIIFTGRRKIDKKS